MDNICGECKYLTMWYDIHEGEVYACGKETGRGTEDPFSEACKEFDLENT